MKEQILTSLWNVTLSVSILIALLLIIRLLFFGRINPKWQYAAWALVAIRLLIPFSVESVFSAMNALEPATQQVEEFFRTVATQPLPDIYDPILPVEQTDLPASINPLENLTSVPKMQEKTKIPDNSSGAHLADIFFTIWIFGAVLVLAYMTLANFRFLKSTRKKRRFADGVRLTYTLIGKRVPIYIDETVSSPCLAGVWHPYIIITPRSAETLERLRYVLLHELCHYKRRDNIFVLLRNLLCAVYWFNPLVGLLRAYVVAIVNWHVTRRFCENYGAMKPRSTAKSY